MKIQVALSIAVMTVLSACPVFAGGDPSADKSGAKVYKPGEKPREAPAPPARTGADPNKTPAPKDRN